MNKHPLASAEFKAIFSKVPRLTVEVVALTPEGVILTKRDIEPFAGTWHLPGGTVRINEKLVDAVKRVAKAELGVAVKVQKLLGYIEYPEVAATGHSWPVGLAFEVAITGGTLTGSEQGRVIKSFKTLPTNMFPRQKDFLEPYLSTDLFG